LCSVLVRIDPRLAVYALASPARADDDRALKRCAAFADGWWTHIDAMLKAAGGAKSHGLLILAYSFDLERREGSLAFAFEKDGRRLATAPLGDEAAETTGSAMRYTFTTAKAG
jgi:hypothetical protein